MDVDTPTAPLPYSVAADNPYATTADALPETVALVLRNPQRLSFARTQGNLALATSAKTGPNKSTGSAPEEAQASPSAGTISKAATSQTRHSPRAA